MHAILWGLCALSSQCFCSQLSAYIRYHVQSVQQIHDTGGTVLLPMYDWYVVRLLVQSASVPCTTGTSYDYGL
eukprot:scaffold184826_cov21-Prasinocladus_malaysianus.AAC.1